MLRTRRMLAVLAVLSLICCSALAAEPSAPTNTPLVVDGSGSELNDGNPLYTGDDEAINNEAGSTGGTTSAPTGDDADADDTDDGAADDDSTPWAYDPVALTAQYDGKTVTVTTLGTVVSRIDMMGQRQEVATRDLTFATKAESGEQLAIITAPKSGAASLRKKASSKSTVLEKCTSGSIVAVLETTKRYAKVHYNGAEGYVLKSSLTFVTPAADAGAFATIAYKGNTTSRNTVKVRMDTSSKSRVVGEYPCGTRVTVLAVDDDWTEIEVDGLRCAILSEFLTDLTGNLPTVAESTAEATPADAETTPEPTPADAEATPDATPADAETTPEPTAEATPAPTATTTSGKSSGGTSIND